MQTDYNSLFRFRYFKKILRHEKDQIYVSFKNKTLTQSQLSVENLSLSVLFQQGGTGLWRGLSKHGGWVHQFLAFRTQKPDAFPLPSSKKYM